MKPWLSDEDLTIYCGDALEALQGMEDGSVDCCVTSPPYWGLRDYGTRSWDGGDVECNHEGSERYYTEKTAAVSSAGAFSEPGEANKERFHCGAICIDQQLGLEQTPDEYVARLVEVFREVRRCLTDAGTLWCNLGDSYAGSWGNQGRKEERGTQRPINGEMLTPVLDGRYPAKESNTGAVPLGLKPKDLVGIPWRVAFALQADGWYLRSDIIWSKPNPMPESVTDRPTKAHEYVFLLSKSPRYWFDQEAVRERYEGDPEYRYGRVGAYQERAINGNGDGTTPTRIAGPRGPDGRHKTSVQGADGSIQHRDGERWPNGGRNVRSVWEIPTQPYPDAHFAVFPEELARRCILAGAPERVCQKCGKASERIVERDAVAYNPRAGAAAVAATGGAITGGTERSTLGGYTAGVSRLEIGWSDCGHDNYRPGTVLDPFGGSGTTALVARRNKRNSILIELNEDYCELAKKRMASWWKTPSRSRDVAIAGQADLFSQ